MAKRTNKLQKPEDALVKQMLPSDSDGQIHERHHGLAISSQAPPTPSEIKPMMG